MGRKEQVRELAPNERAHPRPASAGCTFTRQLLIFFRAEMYTLRRVENSSAFRAERVKRKTSEAYVRRTPLSGPSIQASVRISRSASDAVRAS